MTDALNDQSRPGSGSVPPAAPRPSQSEDGTRHIKVGDRLFALDTREWSHRLPYFRGLFGKDFSEGGQVTIELDGSADAFDLYSKLATGLELDPSRFDVILVLEAMRFSDYFGDCATRSCLVHTLERPIDFRIDYDNVLEVLETACKFNLSRLIKTCTEVVVAESHRILEHEDFALLSAQGAGLVLSQDLLNLPEIRILEAAARWDSLCPGRIFREKVLGEVRLHRFSRRELREVVLPTRLLDESTVEGHLRGKIVVGSGRGEIVGSLAVGTQGLGSTSSYDFPTGVPEDLRSVWKRIDPILEGMTKTTLTLYELDLGSHRQYDSIALIIDGLKVNVNGTFDEDPDVFDVKDISESSEEEEFDENVIYNHEIGEDEEKQKLFDQQLAERMKKLKLKNARRRERRRLKIIEKQERKNKKLRASENIGDMFAVKFHTGDAEVAHEDLRHVAWKGPTPIVRRGEDFSEFVWKFRPAFFRHLRFCSLGPRAVDFSGSLWLRNSGTDRYKAQVPAKWL